METWVWVVVGLLLGALLGGAGVYLFARRRWANAKRAEELQLELDEYRQDVSDHFVQTAELVNNLTRSYKAVYDHLEQGAYRLVDEEALRKQLGDVDVEAVRLEYIGRRNKAAVLGSGAASAGGSEPEVRVGDAAGSGAGKDVPSGAVDAGAAAGPSDEVGTPAAAESSGDVERDDAAARSGAVNEGGAQEDAPGGWTTAGTGTNDQYGSSAAAASDRAASEQASADSWRTNTNEASAEDGDTPWVGEQKTDPERDPEKEEAAQVDGRLR